MEFTYMDIALIPLVMGLVEIVKKFGISKRFIPVVSLFIGLAAGFGFIGQSLSDPEAIRQAIIGGVYIGLAASGLHSGYDNVSGNKERKEREIAAQKKWEDIILKEKEE